MSDGDGHEGRSFEAEPTEAPPKGGAEGGQAAATEPRPAPSDDSRLLATARLLAAGRRVAWLGRRGRAGGAS